MVIQRRKWTNSYHAESTKNEALCRYKIWHACYWSGYYWSRYW